MGTAQRHAPPGGRDGRARCLRGAATAALGAAVVVGVGWLATPVVALARHRTLDARCLRSWRDECAPPVIPLPRRPPVVEERVQLGE
ncbi:hypothetical protein [Actinomycetospora termitidis]|uniref:Uncharacterized protein n=1 Tax=Actinomycetospora termitidis TaxID=3053470 RepID=A0ABT7MER2_9PSEU|nr:hypothetical protein [Actinomycetospora sp. Odt1-22]MDL5159140.1 hypothetical protein [Actinomycetospora sp. Odt1-22]